MYFVNRCAAGRRLAAALADHRNRDTVVLALPRGGVPVAYEVAHALEAPLGVLVAKKLGAPGRPELAIGAVAPEETFLDDWMIQSLGVSPDYVTRETEVRRLQMVAAVEAYAGDGSTPDLRDKSVILIDDGIATGATAIAAARSLRRSGAAHVTVAAPVCSPEAVRRLQAEADAVVYLEAPEAFGAVGFWYEDFTQTTDEEVIALLKRARREHGAHFHGSG